MSASYPIRQVRESELPAMMDVALTAFNSDWPRDELLKLDELTYEPDRGIAALDGEQLVGTALAYSFGLTVPGGATVPTAGVSGVAVLPTHRRRGILSALMRRQLSDIADGPEPLAALFASESAIYGRFGYGAACEHYTFTLKRAEGRFGQLPAAGSAISLRLAEPKEAIGEMRQVYEHVRASRPGMLTRAEGWWKGSVADLEFMRDGNAPLACVIAADDSGPRGYAMYAVRGSWDDDGFPDSTLVVRELFGTDPAAIATLWGNLLTRDLVSTIRTRGRPVDDPLPHLLADPRRTRTRAYDGLWLRLVDLPRALALRQYTCGLDLVIEVTDDLFAANQGCWRLTSEGRGQASCERASGPADIALPVSALSAAYLGGARLGAMAAAGLVDERRPGALAALSAAMWWDPAPWSPVGF